MQSDELKKQVKEVLTDYGRTGLRWSYLIVAAMAVLGAIINLLLPRGWVVWPAVLAVGIMVMLNEASARNTQGLPPLVVYGWFIAALAVWVAMAVVFSAIFPYLMMVGIPAMIWYGTTMYFKNKKRQQVIAERRAKGLCVHCGEPVDAQIGVCEHCGKEMDPEESSLLKRFQVSNRTAEDVERARDILTAKPPTIAAQRKEKALLEKRPRKSSTAAGKAPSAAPKDPQS